MPQTAFAIATNNEIEALDLAQIVADALSASCFRVKAPLEPSSPPQGLPDGPLPRALFLGHGEHNPEYAALREWAQSSGVRIIFINGTPTRGGTDLFLARPFTQQDVERVIYDL